MSAPMATAQLVDAGGAPLGVLGNPLVLAPALETAIREGRAFVASTGMQAVASGNFLNVTLANPAGSVRRVVVFKRRMDSSVAGNGAPLEYGGIAMPAPLGAPTAAPGRNLVTGGPNSGALSVAWSMGGTRVDGSPGTPNPMGGSVPAGGTPLILDEWRILPPGTSFGHYIGGAGGGLAAAARCGVTLYWFEEPV